MVGVAAGAMLELSFLVLFGVLFSLCVRFPIFHIYKDIVWFDFFHFFLPA